MPHVDTWSEWAIWPIKKLFNLMADQAELKKRAENWRYGFDTELDISYDEALQQIKRLKRDTRRADNQNEMLPIYSMLFEIETRRNLEALEQRKGELQKKPTTVFIFELGEFREITIPAERAEKPDGLRLV